MIGGLRPTPRDRRDFPLIATFGASSLDLPDRYDVEADKGDVNGPRDQERNFCTAYAVSELGADEHGIPMDAHAQAAFITMTFGEPILEGADMRDAVSTGRSYGFLPVSKCPFHDEGRDRAFLCDIANWPADTIPEAAKYRMPAYFNVLRGSAYDPFDTIRAELYRHRPDNGIALGMPWYESFNDAPDSGIVRRIAGSYVWHAVSVKGFGRTKRGVEVLKVRSWDSRDGARGYFYFDRETFNTLMRTWGAVAFMYKDVPDDLLTQLRERNLDLAEAALDLLSRLLLVWKR